jgi:uncharacterized membrane protein
MKKPFLSAFDKGKRKKRSFDKNNIFKLFWIFIILSIFGYMIETVWWLFVTGHYESRQGLIFGPFSPIYGFGAVLLTICLERITTKSDILIFLFSAFIGSAFEYICSVFQQTTFGTVSWEYSNSSFNIDGRTNLKYALIWGLFGVLYAKIIHPKFSDLMKKLPDKKDSWVTWVLIVFMIFNFVLSAVAVGRRTERYNGIVASSSIDHMLDKYFPDNFLEKIYPNMKFTQKK